MNFNLSPEGMHKEEMHAHAVLEQKFYEELMMDINL
jgi:hypothetical protein